jgi:hypothetical protein
VVHLRTLNGIGVRVSSCRENKVDCFHLPAVYGPAQFNCGSTPPAGQAPHETYATGMKEQLAPVQTPTGGPFAFIAVQVVISWPLAASYTAASGPLPQ